MKSPGPELKREAIVFKAAGDIGAALSEFRELLGTLNARQGATSGHRELNWDGVPPNKTNYNLFPGDFLKLMIPLCPMRKRTYKYHSRNRFQYQ